MITATTALRSRSRSLGKLLAHVCATVGIAPEMLAGGDRAAVLNRAREGIAYLWTGVLGRPGRPLAAVLGVRPQAIYAAAARGRAAREPWEKVARKLLSLALSPIPQSQSTMQIQS